MSATSSPVLSHSLTSVRFPLPVWPTRVMNVSVTATPCQERTQMKTFTIDNDNNISAFATQEEAAAATATPCQERTQMKTFTIDNDNNISAFATQEEAAAATATPFDSFA